MQSQMRAAQTWRWRPPMLREITARNLAPNIVTAAALCAGLTSLKLANDGSFSAAAAAIMLAAALDGLDGRVARLLGGGSKFGEEFDSLADAISFGCAPAFLLYLWSLHALGMVGWATALFFALAIALRLARFNAGIGHPQTLDWHADFFRGIPAPAAALCALAPLYLWLAGGPLLTPLATAIFAAAIAALAISTLPFVSGKLSAGAFLRRNGAFVAAAASLGVLALIQKPWATAVFAVAVYLVVAPFQLLRFRALAAADASQVRP